MVTPGWGLRGVRERNGTHTGLGQTHSQELLNKKVSPLLSGSFQARTIPGGPSSRKPPPETGKTSAKSKVWWFPGR